MSRQTLAASGGQLTVQIPSMSASSAYQVLLTPAGGGGAQQLYYAVNASIHNGTITASAAAPDGYNVIRLAMGSPYFAGGSGTVNLGYIQLS